MILSRRHALGRCILWRSARGVFFRALIISLVSSLGLPVIPPLSVAVAEKQLGGEVKRITVGARGLGMAAYAAVGGSPTATWYNPAQAAMFRGTGMEMAPSFVQFDKLVPDLAEGVRNYYLYAVTGFDLVGLEPLRAGISPYYHRLNYGTSQVTTAEGVNLGSFDSWEQSYGLAVGLAYGRRFGLGIAFKGTDLHTVPWRYPPIGIPEPQTVGSWSLDLGTVLSPGVEHLSNIHIEPRVSVALRNLGPAFSIKTPNGIEELSQPRDLLLGTALEVSFGSGVGDLDERGRDREQGRPSSSIGRSWTMRTVILAWDMWKPRVFMDTRLRPIHNVGMEVGVGFIAARLGYIYNRDGDIRNFTWGIGLDKRAKEFRFQFDIANRPQGPR
jgi:hypothetical protein